MNFYKWRHRRRAILPAALLAGLFLLPAVSFGASSYLQELEAEAARTDNDTQPKQSDQTKDPAWSPGKQSLSETISAGLSREQFEKHLKQSYYGSYLFYSTLNDADQQKVYEEYQQNNAIDSIRESIKNHMKSE